MSETEVPPAESEEVPSTVDSNEAAKSEPPPAVPKPEPKPPAERSQKKATKTSAAPGRPGNEKTKKDDGDAADAIFKGSVSLWMGWRAFFGAGLACIMGLTALFIGLSRDPGILRTALIISGLALFTAGGLMIPYLVLSIRCLRYTITKSLIEREKGLFIKRVDSLDLGRVKDVELRQNLVQRILKIGTLEIYSSDRTDPSMLIEDIPNPRPVYEDLRNAVIQLSQRRGIISMDR